MCGVLYAGCDDTVMLCLPIPGNVACVTDVTVKECNVLTVPPQTEPHNMAAGIVAEDASPWTGGSLSVSDRWSLTVPMNHCR
jgi:hypothetical protein